MTGVQTCALPIFNEYGSNLYDTNARVISAVTPLLTTANVNEFGSNLYYTNARVKAYIDASITTSDVAEGNNLYYTNARIGSYLQNANLDVQLGNVVVYGNLYIKGNVNEVITNTLEVDDQTITLAKNTPTATLATGSGIIIDGANASILYNYNGGNDQFQINKALNVTGNVKIGRAHV